MPRNAHYFDACTEREIIANGFDPGGWYAGRLLGPKSGTFALRALQEDSPAAAACMAIGVPSDAFDPARPCPQVLDSDGRTRYVECWSLDLSRPRIGFAPADQWVDRADALFRLLQYAKADSGTAAEVAAHRERVLRCLLAVLRAQARRLLGLPQLERSEELSAFVALGGALSEPDPLLLILQQARVALVARSGEFAVAETWHTITEVCKKTRLSRPTLYRRIEEGVLDTWKGKISLFQLESVMAAGLLKKCTEPQGKRGERIQPPAATISVTRGLDR